MRSADESHRVQRCAILAIVLSALGGAPARAQETGAEVPSALSKLVASNERFALDLYGRLSAAKGNLCFSPHSIATALQLTYGGARGETAQEMARALYLELEGSALHAAFGDLAEALEVSGPEAPARLSLAVANRLWGDRRETFVPDFLARLEQHGAGGLELVDFHDAAAAAARINAWVAERTRERIRDLVAPDDVDQAAFVLTNAIAFKGAWAIPFDPELTKQEDFHLAPGRTKPVPMMARQGEFAFLDCDRYQALELPFDGGRFALLCLLPNELDGLAELERSLTPEELAWCLDGLRPTELRVALPRFELDTRFELAEVLASLGMRNAFSAAADFTGMIERPGVGLSRVIHRAFVRVDEEGAEAAAATAVIGKRVSLPRAFRADHPFVFLIRDRETKSLLFLGRVIEP